jgi:nitrogen-specific signal transduction histidine kinase
VAKTLCIGLLKSLLRAAAFPRGTVMTERRRLAHDVRNALNTLALNLQCLPITSGDEALECVDAILTAADEIVALIDQLEQLPDEAPGQP